MVTVFKVVAWLVTVTVTVRTGTDRTVGMPSLGIFVVKEKIVLRMGKPVGTTMGTERVATVLLPILPDCELAVDDFDLVVVVSCTVTVEAFFVTVEAFLVETAVETWLTVMVEVPSPEQCSMKPEETNQREDSK